MLSVLRLPSESSSGTDASGSTEQTELSFDDVTDDGAKASKPHTEQRTGYNEAAFYSPAVGSDLRPQGRIAPRLDLYNACSGALEESYGANRVRSREYNSPENNKSTCRESLPLLSRGDIEYNLQEIICSEKFKKYIEAEFAEVVKVRKNYKSLKKIFLALAVLNIILIICAVSVMPVTLVSLRLENSHVMQSELSLDNALEELILQKLVSPRAREIIRKNVFCGHCGIPKAANTFVLKDPDETSTKECCDQDIFILMQKLKADVSERLTTFNSDIEVIHNSISRLDDAVVGLETDLDRGTKNYTGLMKRNKFQKTLVHQRVDTNNRLLNKLLNRERSLLQMAGSAGRNMIAWENDVSNGDLMFSRNNSIHVAGGGAYFLYVKIQFSKRICSGTKLLEYNVMKKQQHAMDPSFTVAHVKQSCMRGDVLEQALTVQKVIYVDRNENAIFNIQYNSEFHSYLSRDLKTHNFGIFEI